MCITCCDSVTYTVSGESDAVILSVTDHGTRLVVSPLEHAIGPPFRLTERSIPSQQGCL